jgi:ribosomal protein S12
MQHHDPRRFAGLTVSDAAAEAGAMGLVVRIVDTSQPTSAVRRFNRVNFSVDDDKVVDAWMG